SGYEKSAENAPDKRGKAAALRLDIAGELSGAQIAVDRPRGFAGWARTTILRRWPGLTDVMAQAGEGLVGCVAAPAPSAARIGRRRWWWVTNVVYRLRSGGHVGR